MRMREGSEPLPFSWDELVPLLVHPLRVAIVEALRHIGEPLSAADLQQVVEDESSLSVISYHLTTLAQVGAVVVAGPPQTGAATERFYALPRD
jgi:DNA-binding transcriptional ArsR family regulator